MITEPPPARDVYYKRMTPPPLLARRSRATGALGAVDAGPSYPAAAVLLPLRLFCSHLTHAG